jgi:hypothetical protein
MCLLLGLLVTLLDKVKEDLNYVKICDFKQSQTISNMPKYSRVVEAEKL